MAMDIPILAALVTHLYKYSAFYVLENLPDRIVSCEKSLRLEGFICRIPMAMLITRCRLDLDPSQCHASGAKVWLMT
jgi:hypothetical protein